MRCYLDLFRAEQGRRSGSPEQLAETVLVVLLKKTTLERPQPVRVVHLQEKRPQSASSPLHQKSQGSKRTSGACKYLVAPPGDGGDDVAASWVPLHVGGHVVLCYIHHGAVWCVHKGESSIHTANADKKTASHTHKATKQVYSTRIRGLARGQGERRFVSSGFLCLCLVSNWPPESSQNHELPLRAPENAVGLLLVKHLCQTNKTSGRSSVPLTV